MNAHRLGLLVAAAVIAIAAALFVSVPRNSPHDDQGVALLPALGDLNAVTAVTLRKGTPGPTVTVRKTGAQWSVAERGDYPADVTKLRKLLLGLRDAKIVEEKTSNPAEFPVIGVEDPGRPDAAGAEVTVIGAAGRHSVIVGKPAGEGTFVRRGGENQSYAVEPAISLETEPKFWIDSHLIDVPPALIQGLEVRPAGGPAYALHRLNPEDDSFSIEGVPPGRKALDAHALAPPASTFASLTAEDVAAAAGIDFSQGSQTALTLTDGNVITITGAVIGDKHWIGLKSTKNAALTAKAAGRAFEIAGYRYESVFRPLEQLLVPKDKPVTPGPAAPKQIPHAAKPPPKRPSPAPASAP